MLEAILCLVGVGIILGVAEVLWQKKIISGEAQRKFAHIGVGMFVATWPWILSWETIGLLGILMLVGVILNRLSIIKLHFSHGHEDRGYGDVCFAVAIILCAAFTDVKLFFALAMLHLALADGLAAIVGKEFGRKTKYKVFGQTKTLIGSMTFWIVSLYLLGAGAICAYQDISFASYISVLLFLPPILTILENISGYGLDNVVIPLAVIAGLYIAI